MYHDLSITNSYDDDDAYLNLTMIYVVFRNDDYNTTNVLQLMVVYCPLLESYYTLLSVDH